MLVPVEALEALILRSPASVSEAGVSKDTQVGCCRLAHSIVPISGKPEIGGGHSVLAAILRDARCAGSSG
jgi:hypothetical protein